MEVKHPYERKSHCSTLEAYEETPVFIPMGITEGVVKLVAREFWGSAGLGGTDSEALQGWLLKFGDHNKKLCISVETSVDWLSNRSLTWVAYWGFMSEPLILLYKLPGVCPVGIGETWRQLFAKCVGPEAPHT